MRDSAEGKHGVRLPGREEGAGQLQGVRREDVVVGKPVDEHDWLVRLRKLAGRAHHLTTGLALVDGGDPHWDYEGFAGVTGLACRVA